MYRKVTEAESSVFIGGGGGHKPPTAHSNRFQLFHYTDDGWKYHPKHVEQFPYINCVTLHLDGYTRILEYY
jgi:hypothetical protein